MSSLRLNVKKSIMNLHKELNLRKFSILLSILPSSSLSQFHLSLRQIKLLRMSDKDDEKDLK